MPLMAVELAPPLMTGVNCCHVEFELFGGWRELGAVGVGACCCDWDEFGGGELTGVEGFELKLLIL